MERLTKSNMVKVSLVPQPAESSSPTKEASTVSRRRGRPTHEESEQRATRKVQADFLVGCSIEERAWCVQLIRLLRTNYWLSHLLKNILRLDADRPQLVTIEDVRRQIDQAEDLDELVRKIQFVGRTGWWRDHPVVNAVAEEDAEIYQYRSDSAIRQLIESAKKGVVK